MKTRSNQSTRRAGALVLGMAILLGPVSALPQSRPNRRAKTWKVKDSDLRLSIEEGRISSCLEEETCASGA